MFGRNISLVFFCIKICNLFGYLMYLIIGKYSYLLNFNSLRSIILYIYNYINTKIILHKLNRHLNIIILEFVMMLDLLTL